MTDSATFGGMAEWQYNNSSDGVKGERRASRRIERGKNPTGFWDKALVNSLCVIDLDEVWKCENKLLRGSGNEATSANVKIAVKETFMAGVTQESPRGVNKRLEAWADTTDVLISETHAVIVRDKPGAGLTRLESAAIAVTAVAVLSAVAAALIFQRRQKLRRLVSLMKTKEKLQVALLESTPPPRDIGKDICFRAPRGFPEWGLAVTLRD